MPKTPAIGAAVRAAKPLDVEEEPCWVAAPVAPCLPIVEDIIVLDAVVLFPAACVDNATWLTKLAQATAAVYLVLVPTLL